MGLHDVTVGSAPSTELHRIALRIGEVVEREIRALGFQDEEIQFTIIATRKKSETEGETGMVSTVDIEELVRILTRNVEALLTPESMAQWRELILARGERPS